jgi:hypothetical protein
MITVTKTNFPISNIIQVEGERAVQALNSFGVDIIEGVVTSSNVQSFLDNNAVISNRVFDILKREGFEIMDITHI